MLNTVNLRTLQYIIFLWYAARPDPSIKFASQITPAFVKTSAGTQGERISKNLPI